MCSECPECEPHQAPAVLPEFLFLATYQSIHQGDCESGLVPHVVEAVSPDLKKWYLSGMNIFVLNN